MKLALDCPQGPVFLLEETHLQKAVEASRSSPRGRIMLPIQRSESAPVQRLLNVIQPGSYVRPHLHPRPQAVELVQILQGAVVFILFEENGRILQKAMLRAGSPAGLIDVEAGVWHTMAALEPDSVILEIKGGPYDRAQDKIFAPWAPEENAPEARAYLARLLQDPPQAGRST